MNSSSGFNSKSMALIAFEALFFSLFLFAFLFTPLRLPASLLLFSDCKRL